MKFARNLARAQALVVPDAPVDLKGRYWSAKQLILKRVFPVSEATLQAHARKHGIGRMLGRTRVFSAEDVQALYELLPCPPDAPASHGPPTGSKPDVSNLSPAAAMKRAQALLAKPPRTKGDRKPRTPGTAS